MKKTFTLDTLTLVTHSCFVLTSVDSMTTYFEEVFCHTFHHLPIN
jgi:hypothetical protein